MPQPPISGGSASRWLRSRWGLVSLVSFPKGVGQGLAGRVRVETSRGTEVQSLPLLWPQASRCLAPHHSARLQVLPQSPCLPH